MTKVVGVRFRQVGKIYFFAPGKYSVETGQHVIVETARGVEYGQVVLGEREVEDMKMAEYMEEHIGEEYIGMISSVMSFGMFVQLDNLIEGLVPLRLLDDYFVYDEERMTLTGEKSNIRYTIGERVKIKVVAANKQAKTIDFKIIKKM